MINNYEDVELKSMQFANKKNDIELTFCHRTSTMGEIIYRKKLLCENIFSMKMMFDVDKEDSIMPYYLIVISIIKKDNMFLLETVGDIELNLTCENIVENELQT